MSETIKAKTRTVIVWKLATLDDAGDIVERGEEQLLRLLLSAHEHILEPGDEVPMLVPLREDQRAVVLKALERERAQSTALPPLVVNVPPQAAPVVNVIVPERKPMVTDIHRDSWGQIKYVTERPATPADLAGTGGGTGGQA